MHGEFVSIIYEWFHVPFHRNFRKRIESLYNIPIRRTHLSISPVWTMNSMISQWKSNLINLRNAYFIISFVARSRHLSDQQLASLVNQERDRTGYRSPQPSKLWSMEKCHIFAGCKRYSRENVSIFDVFTLFSMVKNAKKDIIYYLFLEFLSLYLKFLLISFISIWLLYYYIFSYIYKRRSLSEKIFSLFYQWHFATTLKVVHNTTLPFTFHILKS